jgi:hypothetical protein
VNLGATAVLGAMSAVVVQADDFDAVFLAEPAGVMLKAELGTLCHLEVASVAIETPNDGPVRSIDFMHSASITSGDEIVSFGVLVYTVDMEVVPCI